MKLAILLHLTCCGYLLSLTTITKASNENTDGVLYCPSGWVLRESKCYKLFTESKTFEEAEEYCKTNESHLTSVTSRAEHDFLIDYILREVAEAQLKYVWVGGKRKRTRYIWTDLEPFKYEDWHAAKHVYSDLEKYPNHTCVQFVTTSGHYVADPQFGSMVNHPCTGQDNFICQRRPDKYPNYRTVLSN